MLEKASRNGITKVKLKQVPRFLVNAFNFINRNGLMLEGLFRREGNAARLNQNNYAVYLGEAPIPSTFTVHDVCSMVKRFFRDLKKPLLPNATLRKALLELVKKNEDAPITIHDFNSVFEVGFEMAKRNLDRVLPDAHMGTLGYLMRQLLGISRHSDKHQMDAANLATVFAPTIFRDEKIRRKDRRGSQDDLLTVLRSDTKMQIAAVQLLIERANWIGLHPNCYVTSVHHHRSNSAAASPRQPFMSAAVSLKDPSERKPSSSRRNDLTVPSVSRQESSLKTQIDALRHQKSSTKRRSSSAFRGIINGIGDRILRRSPSRERGKATNRRQSSPAIVVAGEIQHRPRLRHDIITRLLTAVQSAEALGAHIAHGHEPLQSSSTRTSRSRQPVAITSTRPAAHLAEHQGRISRTGGSQSIGRSSHRHTEVVVHRRDSGKKRGETPPRRINKVLKDNPVSMLGEEHFNPSYREQHERSRRRHTTPVKTSTALRRNQPNTRHSGLQQPKRRATVVNVHEQEKENRHRTGSVSTTNSCDDIEGAYTEDSLNLADSSVDILTQLSRFLQLCSSYLVQKGHESRLRRAKRQQRRELSSILQDSLFDSSSSKEPVERKENVLDRVRTVSVGCSPIIFPRTPGESKESRGSAVVGETVVVTPVSIPPSDESLPVNLPTDICASPPPQTHSDARPLVTKHSPSKTAAVVSKQTPTKRVLPQERVTHGSSGDGSNKEYQQVVFRVPSLPTSNLIPPPKLGSSSGLTNNVNLEKKGKAIPTAVAKAPTVCVAAQGLAVLKSSVSEDNGDRFVKPKKSTSEAQSALASSSSSSVARDEPFVASKEMKSAILSANCQGDLVSCII
ncbi:hypothetical protein COOONC_04443 [Cooperia oncophora]